MSKKAGVPIEFRSYDLPPDFPLLLLDGDDWIISDMLSDRQHFHNCLEIGICRSDSGTLYFGQDALQFSAGDVTCISPNILHTTCSTRGTRSRWSYLFIDPRGLLGNELYGAIISSSVSDGARSADGHGSAFVLHELIRREDAPRIFFLATTIIDELRERRDDCRTVVRSLMYVLYRDIVRISESRRSLDATRQNDSFALRPALDIILNDHQSELSVQMLAGTCHLSPTHFRRTFKATMGMTPLAFLNSTRINHACALLLTTGDSILAISEKVGFSSVSNFNRCFQQAMGVSPRAYRGPAPHKSLTPTDEQVFHYQGWMLPEKEPGHIRNIPDMQ